jgi:aryl-alcohol dehydrogenase-like predicted oxidoreductase
LAEARARDRICIATKVGLDWKDGRVFRNASRARIRKEVEDSLRRLRTDVIDIYQVHWPDPKTPIEETAEAMLELCRAGKIRAIGVQQLDRFARENYGKRVIHLAIRWVLDREGITFALWGARRPEQLGAVSEIAGWKLDALAMREIDRIVASCVKEPVGPEFMAPPDRLAA